MPAAHPSLHRQVLRSCILPAILSVGAVLSAAEPAPHPRANPFLAALTPAGAKDHARLGPVPRLTITARLDPSANRITGQQRLTLPNPATVPLTTVALRGPANHPCFQGAALEISEATWNGQPLPPAQGRGQSTATGKPAASGTTAAWEWDLPKPLAVGASGELVVRFTTTVSTRGGYHGLLNHADDTWTLYHWHPELPRWDGSGWQLPPVVPIGDQSQAVLAHLLVDLTIPAGLQVISGGSVVGPPVAKPDDQVQVKIAAPLCRNLAVVLSRAMEHAEQQAGDTLVRSWYRAEHPHSGKRALAAAADSLQRFSARIGPYPFAELDVVEAAQGDGVGGMEASGLVIIDDQAYGMCEELPDGIDGASLPGFMLAMPVAHEVGHQWWYGIVGNDAHQDPWLDESLTNWLGLWYCGQAYGPVAGQGGIGLMAGEARSQPSGMGQSLTLSLDQYDSMETYGAAVYGRGALFYQTLYRELGDGPFFAFLKDYHDRYRFAVATPAGWRDCLDRAIGHGRAEALTQRWLEAKGLTVQDLLQATRPLPATPPGGAPAPAAR